MAPVERVLATYIVETPQPLQRALDVMAGEQSTGTFIRVPGETDDLRARHAARVETLEELEPTAAPSLPGSAALLGPPEAGAVYRRARVVVSFPLSNMGPSLPNLLATIAGNLFELREFSGLRLWHTFASTVPCRFTGTATVGAC